MATVFTESIDELDDPIRQEVEFGGGLGRGDSGPAVRRTQEWLCLHDRPLAVDGVFGVETERTLAGFQQRVGHDVTGSLDFDTWAVLTYAMRAALERQPAGSMALRDAALLYARRHLRMLPRDVGGPDRGPWARLYARAGSPVDGPVSAHGRPWRARFAAFVLTQAAETVDSPQPVVRTVSPSVLVARAATAEVFVPGVEESRGGDGHAGLLWYVGHVASAGTTDGSVWLEW